VQYNLEPAEFVIDRQFTVWKVAVDMNEIVEALESDILRIDDER